MYKNITMIKEVWKHVPRPITSNTGCEVLLARQKQLPVLTDTNNGQGIPIPLKF